MFQSLLIANRGEIACRIIRTAHAMGLRTVAVHSTVDAEALHVRLADESVELAGRSATETYLDIDALVAAARLCHVDAVHPGYGFLSENPAFVDACATAGLAFVGPTAAAMRAMGLKDAAKALMAEAGVPVVPGYHGESQDPDRLAAEAARIGYPVLIKARAGGGGKGMRRVDRPGHFPAALAGARREAAASFGDDRVLIEKYIPGPRHVEVQIFGDTHGTVVHLFERDCSLQRRHQKVIEEAPAPGMTPAVRHAMTSAAVRAAAAIGYIGAGTVEFIADGREGLKPDSFWFMEMNTRLQVEHPVTEAITGLDLVEWQLRVAAGERLPLEQTDIALAGHAIEARLYAEDAAAGFLPATGTLACLAFGDGSAVGAGGRGVGGCRVDSGVVEGDVVSAHYDPMLAKLIACGPVRDIAIARLTTLLVGTTVLGTVTNRDFLLALCRHPDVRAARLDTDLIARALPALTGHSDDEHAERTEARAARALVAVLRAGACDSLEIARSDRPGEAVGQPDTPEPTPGGKTSEASLKAPSTVSLEALLNIPLSARLGLWSLWGQPRRSVTFCDHAGTDDRIGAVIRPLRSCHDAGITAGKGLRVEVQRTGALQWSVADSAGTLALECDPAKLIYSTRKPCRVVVEGRGRDAQVLMRAGCAEVRLGENVHRVAWPVPGATDGTGGTGDTVLAPMPGRVIDVACAVGDAVRAGQTLVTLEAMKMEHTLVAPRDGSVAALAYGLGDQVAQGAVLVRLAGEND